jgi:hypothetical protein
MGARVGQRFSARDVGMVIWEVILEEIEELDAKAAALSDV